MNASPTFDRAHAALRLRIMSGEWRPGERIDVAPLADAIGASTTPVRDALFRLVGERLLTMGNGEGFAMPLLTEPELYDLYDWNQELLSMMLRRARGGPPPDLTEADTGDMARRTAFLFTTIAKRTGNEEHRVAIDWVNTRLNAVRHIESRLIKDAEEDVAVLRKALTEGDLRACRSAIAHYHRRRIRVAGRIIFALHRPDLVPTLS